MNNEIIKAMNRKPKKDNAFRKWWSKNSYKVYRVIFFPFWIGGIITEKIKRYLNSREVWTEERIKTILDYYIPRRAEWDETDKSFYFFDNGYGWSIGYAKRYLKGKDRRWWKLHCGWSGGEIRDYLIDKYEIIGFNKQIGDCSNGWTEIIFTMKQ